jgi:hypothetical protein
VIADLQHEIEKALAQHRRVLLNLLPASKTGLNAPSEEAVIELLQLAPNSIDVVVDACQLRSPFVKMGDWVRQGWMVQLSGSKFLTGPPFSGTLIIPRHLRSRVSNISVLLDRAPTVGSKQDWSAWWRDHFSVLPHEDVTSLE